MSQTTFVQVFECGPEGRRATHRIPIGLFIGYALERLSADHVMQIRNDLTVLGRSRIHGDFGRWHEYQLATG